MIALRLYFIAFIILSSPYLVWGNDVVESIPTLEPSSTIIKPTLFGNISTYLILFSLGAIVLASGIWYRVYHKKHLHPYLFLEEAEIAAAQAEEEGNLPQAIKILDNALHTIENDPKKFPQNSKGRRETIWFLKRKLQELDEALMEIND